MEINAQINEFNNSKLQGQVEDKNYILQKTSTPCFTDIKLKIQEVIENLISPKELTLDEKLNEKFLELDFGAEFNIEAQKINPNDAIFFINVLNQENLINYTVEDNKLSLNIDNKRIETTNSLLNMLQTSFDTKKPIRLDFDNDITVILKLDKEGKIQAHFIPGTSEVESYLKNNISSLKQTFEDEEINYSYLGYSNHKQNKENNQNKKEKRNNQ